MNNLNQLLLNTRRGLQLLFLSCIASASIIFIHRKVIRCFFLSVSRALYYSGVPDTTLNRLRQPFMCICERCVLSAFHSDVGTARPQLFQARLRPHIRAWLSFHAIPLGPWWLFRLLYALGSWVCSSSLTVQLLVSWVYFLCPRLLERPYWYQLEHLLLCRSSLVPSITMLSQHTASPLFAYLLSAGYPLLCQLCQTDFLLNVDLHLHMHGRLLASKRIF